MESLDHFGANLRRYREARGLTQTKLAETLDVQNVYVCQLETGFRTPSAALLVKFADALGCTVTDLLTPPKKGRRP